MNTDAAARAAELVNALSDVGIASFVKLLDHYTAQGVEAELSLREDIA